MMGFVARVPWVGKGFENGVSVLGSTMDGK